MKKTDIKIAIDAGHGRNTPGKRSPDGVFREWAWCKDVAEIVVETLRRRGYDCFLVNPEETDITLAERCRRINRVIEGSYTDKVLSVSIHCNAAGNGKQWYNARGWEVYTYTSPSPNSVKLAKAIYEAAKDAGFRTRPESHQQCYRKKNLAMCREPHCPAVLVEHFFMDNREDCQYLLSPLSIYECAEVLVSGILDYIDSLCTSS